MWPTHSRRFSDRPLLAPQAVHPDSALAANLRACCEFRAGDAAAALHTLGGLPTELTAMPAPPAGLGQLAAELGPGTQAVGAALIWHNAAVFCDGQGGLQVGMLPLAALWACWCQPALRASQQGRLEGIGMQGHVMW